GNAIAVDGDGNAYVTGTSDSDGVFRFGVPFPTTDGNTFPGGIFVTKLNPTGSALVYSTFLGPGNALAIAVDAAGNAYVTGFTSFDDFPTTPGAFQTTFRGGVFFFRSYDFLTMNKPDGSGLVCCPLLGPRAAPVLSPPSRARHQAYAAQPRARLPRLPRLPRPRPRAGHRRGCRRQRLRDGQHQFSGLPYDPGRLPNHYSWPPGRLR